jgi:hypothetical protein
MIPLTLKLACTAFVAVLVPVYWWQYGPSNFLWACDLALFITVAALWLESRRLASAMAVAVLLPELAWNADYFSHLIAGQDVIGLNATGYMFDASIPQFVRALSLFHVVLPWLLLWLVYRLGYQRSAYLLTIAVAWVVLPLSWLVSDTAQNINWVFGFGDPPRPWLPGLGQVALLMVAMPIVAYLPTHFVLRWLFAERAR